MDVKNDTSQAAKEGKTKVDNKNENRCANKSPGSKYFRKRFSPVNVRGQETNNDLKKGVLTEQSGKCQPQQAEGKMNHEKPKRGFSPIPIGRYDVNPANIRKFLSSKISAQPKSQKSTCNEISKKSLPIHSRQVAAKENLMSVKKSKSSEDTEESKRKKSDTKTRRMIPSYFAKYPISQDKPRIKGTVAKYVKDCYSGNAADELIFNTVQRAHSDTEQLHDLGASRRLILKYKDQAKTHAEEKTNRDPLTRKRGMLHGENEMQKNTKQLHCDYGSVI